MIRQHHPRYALHTRYPEDGSCVPLRAQPCPPVTRCCAAGSVTSDSPPRVVIYAREVTRPTPDTAAAQVAACRRYAADQGWVVAAVYYDVGAAASAFRRPGFAKAMTALRLGEASVLLALSMEQLLAGERLEAARIVGAVEGAPGRVSLHCVSPPGEVPYGNLSALLALLIENIQPAPTETDPESGPSTGRGRHGRRPRASQ